MAGSASYTQIFTDAIEMQERIYVETLTSSVFGEVTRVFTDGVEIRRINDGNIIAVVMFDVIQLAERVPNNIPPCKFER